MKHQHSILFALLISVLLLTGAQAQKKLYIKDHTGGQINYNLSLIRSLTFSESNLVINKPDGAPVEYLLADIRYLNFEEDALANISKVSPYQCINIYPNPASEELKIDYVRISSADMQLSVIDIEGKTRMQQNIKSSFSTGSIKLVVSHLPKGLYVIRLQDGVYFENKKFIKN